MSKLSRTRNPCFHFVLRKRQINESIRSMHKLSLISCTPSIPTIYISHKPLIKTINITMVHSTPLPFLLLLTLASAVAVSAAGKTINIGVTYAVVNRAPGCTVFTTHIGIPAAKQAMSSATNFVLNLFNETSCPTDRKNNVKKITLFIDNMKAAGGPHSQHVSDAYSAGNEIHVNANFLGTYKGNIRREFVGIVYHHVASIWQWNGTGEAPKGLVSGIAEFARMDARYGTSQKVRLGDGSRWDQGDGVTCRFLEYCNMLKKGFVKELNRRMRYGYTNAYFVDLLGKPVDQVWKDYKAKYPRKHY